MSTKATKSSKYKNVYYRYHSGTWDSANGRHWYGSIMINKVRFEKHFKEEKEAAKFVDKILISKGFEPKNILKSKNN